MKFKELRIGDVFKYGDMLFKKISDYEAEFGKEEYNRIFNEEQEIDIMTDPFKVILKNRHWIPKDYREKIFYVKPTKYVVNSENNVSVYKIISDSNNDYVISPYSFYFYTNEE